MITITLVAALFSLGLTLFVLWANPYRFSNQVFALVLLVQTAWLGCVYRAMQIGAHQTPENTATLEWWFRANAAVISFLPATMWLLKCAIVAEKRARRKAIYQSLPLFALGLLSAGLCSTQAFISRDAFGVIYRGPAYYIDSIIGLSVYILFVVETFHMTRIHGGIRRVELQFLALNAGGAALLLLALNALGNFLQDRAFPKLGVLLVFAASALTACALLMHRVFNAWEVFLQFAQRLWFTLILSSGIYCLWRATTDLFAEPFGLLFSVAVFSPIAVWLDKRSRTWFDITGEKKLGALRQYAIRIAQTEPKTDALVYSFEALFTEKFHTRSSHILLEDGPVHGRNEMVIARDRAGYGLLCELGWATPESLERRRSTDSIKDLLQFLEENVIGLLVPVPRGSSTPSLLLALAVRHDERPYTFPEIERIQNLAELVNSILARSKFTTQAALHARTEFLNMMSRSLAHDLKNLITPVSTYLIHTEKLFSPPSAEAEVHSAAKRAMQSIGDYVRETLSFSDRLEPNFQLVSVKRVCDAVLQVTSTHAAKRDISIQLSVSHLESIVADGVLIQRMLGNLVNNAVDASAVGQVVSLNVVLLHAGRVRFEVRDNGSGIAAEHRSRVFDPYFTTKKFGDEMRGFGLGLTIAHRIALLHRGTIHVQSRPGQQTIVTVDMPGDQGSVSPTAP